MTKGKEILIVEDEEDIGTILKRLLEEQGFQITLVKDGRTAAAYLKKKNFDLLIVDMLLPGEHGLDLLQMKGQNFTTPVIIMSGIYNKADFFEKAKDSNIKYFIKKPFDLAAFLEKVNSAIDADQI